MGAKQWLKGCDLCNVAICDEMQTRIDDGKSEKAAAEEIANESNAYIGEILYTPDAVLNRFRYYKRGRGVPKKNPPKPKAKPAAKPKSPPAPPVLGAMERAKKAVELLHGIEKTDPQFRDALFYVGNWINAQFEK